MPQVNKYMKIRTKFDYLKLLRTSNNIEYLIRKSMM